MLKANRFPGIIALLFFMVCIGSCGGGDGGEADITAPSVPADLSVAASPSPVDQINLSWTASTDNVGVAGYKIYRNSSYLKSVSTTSTSDTGLNLLTQYCYTVSGYDSAGNESAQSSQVCATTLGFTISDSQGTWYSHDLQSGDAGPGRSASAWFYGWSTYDANGNCIDSYDVKSDGSTKSGCSYSNIGDVLIVDPLSGVYNGIGNSHGKISKWKDLILGTGDDGTGDYLFGVSIKSGGTFTTADLQGTWNFHVLATGDAPQWTGWAYGQMNVDASGKATFTSFFTSSGPTVAEPPTFSISPDGVVTAGEPLFHGVMNMSKDLVIATWTSDDGGYYLQIMQKIGGGFSTADLQGNWWTHGLVSGDAPAQRIGWFWTNGSSDASGNFTAITHRDSTGLTTLPADMTFSVNSNGVITSAALPSFYGIMNQRKDMIVYTFTGHPSLDTGVGGYVLGITLK